MSQGGVGSVSVSFSMSMLKKIIFNLSILLVVMLVGAVLGVAGGFGLGWLLSMGYESRGPGDPGHAPAYVALGLALYGAGLGAVAGIAGGVGLCVLLAARRAAAQQTMQRT